MLERVYDPMSQIDQDPVSSALKGAAVAGAIGMVAAHQPWGRRASRFLGRIVDTTKKTFKSMENIRQGEGLRHYTKSNFKELYNQIEKNWTESIRTVDSMSLNANHNGSLAAYIRSVETTVAQARQKAQDAWLNDYVLKDALDEAERQGFDKNTKDNVRSFLNKAVRNAENFARNMELARQHNLQDQALSFAERMSRSMQQRYRDAVQQQTGPEALIIQKIQDAVEQEVKKTAYSLDVMERSLGTSSQQNIIDSSIQLLTRAHKMTWREARKGVKAGTIEDTTFRVRGKTNVNGQVKVKDVQISVAAKMKEIEDLIKQQHGLEGYKRLQQITVDESNLFVTDTGNAFSKATSGQIWRDFLAAARNTLPGKLFKIGDIDNALKVPAVQMIHLEANDPVLRSKLKKLHEEDKYHIRIGKDIWSLDVNAQQGAQMSYNQELNNGDNKIVSGLFGFYHTQLEALSGKTKTSLSDNWLFRKLDIFQDREEYSGSLILNKLSMFIGQNSRAERFGEQLNMSPEYAERWYSAIDDLGNYIASGNRNFMTDLSEDTKDFVLEYMETARKISEIFKTSTYVLPMGSVKEILKSNNLNSKSRQLFELLERNNTEEMFEAFTSRKAPALLRQALPLGGATQDYLNSDLRNLIRAAVENPDLTRNKISLVTNEMRLAYGTDIIDLFRSPMQNTTYTFDEVLRKEIAKEALLRQGIEQTSATEMTVKYDRINNLLQEVSLNECNLKEADKLAQFSIWQYHTHINAKPKVDEDMYFDYLQRMKATHELLRGDTSFAKHFQDTYSTVMGDEISWLEGEMSSEVPGVESLEHYVIVNRSASPWDLVKGLNDLILNRDATRIKKEISNIVGGLTASRDDMSKANLYTFVPFFAMKRLSDELNRVGLGFSAESTKSVGDLAMSFMTKRIMPIAVGATYLDWTDDVTKSTTEQGLWEGFTAGVANIDLAARKVVSGLGADEWLRQVKAVNPIWQYWGDKDDYQGYEERKHYYESGYTPVRKAAWWTWGGVSEARGGEIQYWQPNIVRRAKSNWKDMSLYNGSMWDKWSHSLIPTPTNPLSPLFALVDPYWMERMHKEDRPYPISGPMFTEGTPWGAILNPTIGALIKPEREEHPVRLRHGVDILSLVHNANISIRERARDFIGNHYLTIKNGQISPVDFNVWNAPTSDTKVVTLQTNSDGYAKVIGGTYGIYGTGDKDYAIGSSGGSALAAYVPHLAGRAPGGGGVQNLAAGFNELAQDPDANLHLLVNSERPSVRESFRQALLGNTDHLARNGDVIVNEEGKIGIYRNRRLQDPQGTKFNFAEKTALKSVVSPYGREERQSLLQLLDPLDDVKIVNANIIARSKEHVDSPFAVDDDLGFVSAKKMSAYNPSTSMELLEDADVVDDLMNQGNGASFVRNASTSLRLIGGIYGYMASETLGFGVHEEKILANSSDMYTFTRGFWDANLGGFGGAVSEIGRRFIPNYQRLTKVNPLMNQMPDWLPERFRMGDIFSAIPKGEMRLPGAGYESINELHPDVYGRYGAFDRFKILADVAPHSPEYRLWREIAKHTVTDPALIQEMEEVKQRARVQGKKHDFYSYKLVGENDAQSNILLSALNSKRLEYRNVIVSEVLGYGKFRSGETIFKMAGISVKGNPNENAQEVLSRYLHVGQEVTVAVDPNVSYSRNRDAQKSVNAAVFVQGESVNKLMMEAGDATERKSDKSSAATLGQLSAFQQTIGTISELVAHADIPIISDQWLRVRSPLESYEAELIYGTPYQSWAHPINTFLYPAFERSIYERSIMSNLFTKVTEMERTPEINTRLGSIPVRLKSRQITRGPKQLMYMTSILGNRNVLVGHAIANMIDAGNPKLAVPISHGLDLITGIGHILIGGKSYFSVMSLGAEMGYEVARINEVADKKTKGKYMAVGAAVGAAFRAAHHFTDRGDWVPDRVKRNWQMQAYLDRLTFIKYQGLYHEAARRAKEEEGVDIETVMRTVEEKDSHRKTALKYLKDLKEALNSAYGGKTNAMKNYLLKVVNQRISELHPDDNLIEGGKYTQSAIVYKKAADATMYGLKKGASWSSIISALPTNDREYFMEFVSETDKDKREKILKTVSPSLRRALQVSWGMRQDPKVDNETFFQYYYLPDSHWAGWRPEVDINDIAVKTIENEGLNLSDFGFYESNLREPMTRAATPLPFDRHNADLKISSELRSLLRGKGLKNVEVNITEKNTMGPTDIIADIGVWTGLVSAKRKIDTAIASAWI